MENQTVITAKDFGASIRTARQRERLTQRELALAVGTGERFIVELENGKETAQLGKALEAAAALGIKIALAYES